MCTEKNKSKYWLTVCSAKRLTNSPVFNFMATESVGVLDKRFSISRNHRRNLRGSTNVPCD